ncbi:MAG: hypothetical protein ACPG6V_04980 [Flavobacteriales bacterium]
MQRYFIAILVLCLVQNSISQVGIGTLTPHSSAIVDVSSSNKGFLPTRLTRLQRNSINNPATGLLLYCKDCCIGEGVLSVFNGTVWNDVVACSILDTDHDGVTDSVDVDSDNDGILDVVECPIVQIAEPSSPSETFTSSNSLTINSSGGTNSTNGLNIEIENDASFQIYLENQKQMFSREGNIPVLSINGVSYSGSSNDDYANNDFEKIRMTNVMGTGTFSDPYYVKIEQYANIVNSGYDANDDVKFTTIYSYVYPEKFLKIQYIITPPSSNSSEIKLYHIADTYLAGGDNGPAFAIDKDSLDAVANTSLDPILIGVYKSPSFLGFVESNGNFDHYYSGEYSDDLHDPALTGGNLVNHFNSDPSTDNEVGIQYNLGTPTSEIKRSNYLGFNLPRTVEIALNETKSCSDFDFDNDGIPDYLDLDSDNDGIPDNVEAQQTYTISPSGLDDDLDGLDNAYEPSGITPYNTTPTTDKADYHNTDSDNDGQSDTDEKSITLSNKDSDKDGLDDNTDASTDYTDPNGKLF